VVLQPGFSSFSLQKPLSVDANLVEESRT
jgi:hypothetical protein